MKIKHTLFLILFILPFGGSAQMTLHWKDSIPGYRNSVFYSSVTYLDSNSNYYSGQSRIISSEDHMFLQKRDSAGLLLWETQLYPDSSAPDTDAVYGYNIRIDKHQNTLIGLNGCPLLIKTDPSGSTIFKKFFPYRTFASVQPISNDHSYVLSFGDSAITILHILDSAGLLIREDTLSFGGGGYFSWDCIREDASGNVIVYFRSNSRTVFYHYRNDQFIDSMSMQPAAELYIDQNCNRYIYNAYGMLTKYDSTWALQWTFNSGNVSSLKVDSSGFIFTSDNGGSARQGTIKKYNSSGALLWSYAFNRPPTIYSLNSFDLNNRSEVIVSGIIYDSPGGSGMSSGIYVAAISSSGHLLDLYKKTIPGVNYAGICQQALSKNDQFFFIDNSDIQMYNLNCLNLRSHPNVAGFFYYDADIDCADDTLEARLPDVNVNLNPGNYYAESDGDGKFKFEVPDGNYLLDHSIPANWQSTCPVGQVAITVSGGVMSGPTAFGLSAIPNQNDLSIDFTHSRVRQNRDITFVIHYQNLGTTVISGEVQFDYDSLFSFVSSQTIPDVIAANRLVWNFAGLIPGESRYIIFVLHSGMAPGGSTFTNTASITGISGDTHPWNNSQTENGQVVASVDPNEKYVEPQGSGLNGNISYADSILCYKIVFQNTGNDTAFYVQVIDTLDPSLDPLTFYTGAIYPHGTCTLSGNGVLRFFFDPVLIPDSTTDEPNSHGYINYFIKTRPNLPLGTTIRNKADIYFDYNPPVTTNSTINTINSTVSVPQINNAKDQLAIYPNPTNDKLFVRSNMTEGVFEATLFNAQGKRVGKTLKGSESVVFDVKNLSPGMYILKILKGDMITFKNVVVIGN